MKSRSLTLIATAVALMAVPTVAQAKDADGDGMADRWENRHHVRAAAADPDGDRVDNRNEFRERSRPRDRDSNDDGQADGREDRDRDGLRNAGEDATGNDPVDKDTDDDGTTDGLEQAGVVSAYDESSGELTIDLANGGSVTGLVTDDTDVECVSEAAAEDDQGAAGASANPPGGESGEWDDGPGERGFDHGGFGGFGDDGGRGNCDDRRVSEECPEGTLAVGARVHQAELRVSGDGAEWVEIEIITE